MSRGRATRLGSAARRNLHGWDGFFIMVATDNSPLFEDGEARRGMNDNASEDSSLGATTKVNGNATTKYVFVTGGVVSSLGKGISAAALGLLLKKRGLVYMFPSK